MKRGSERPIWRAFTMLIAALMVASFMGGAIAAQETSTITSTQQGDMPTSGGARPGPSTPISPPVRQAREGVMPVSISIERAEVEAVIEVREIVDGIMQDPTGPWVVSWYEETPKIGGDGNTVMAGHVDYWNVGPAVFYNIGRLEQGDLIHITGEDGKIYTYKVHWVRDYDANNAPIQEIVGPTDQRSLTLITCGGQFDYATGQYLSRTVVRALYVGSHTPT